ncbi:hypothetical protein M8J77_026144 [Diaphorina citri]|nr:hypothetical protein M8J77_026144 [Diaphorina citri]
MRFSLGDGKRELPAPTVARNESKLTEHRTLLSNETTDTSTFSLKVRVALRWRSDPNCRAARPSCATAAYCFLCILMKYFPNQAATRQLLPGRPAQSL